MPPPPSRQLHSRLSLNKQPSPPRAKLDSLPDDAIVSICKRMDAVTVARVSRVCRHLRRVILHEYSRGAESSLVPAHGSARLFVVDRKRVILETFADEPSLEGPASLSTSPSTSRPPMASPIDRPYSHSMIRSTPSNHSIHDFLATIHEKPLPTMKQRIAPRKTVYVKDQMASTKEAAWAYKFDAISSWMEEYDVCEVFLQNFASFLERDKGAMAEPGIPAIPHSPSMVCTLPQGDHSAATALPPWVFERRIHPLRMRTERKSICYDELSEEMMEEMAVLSGGRFERLASNLADINPLHLIFKDYSLYNKRPVALVFWFLSLLRGHLRHVTFDRVQGADTMRLEGALPMAGIVSLTVKQPDEKAAIAVDEEILLSWLRLPAHERQRLRARFHGCQRLSPKGVCRFIREWQVTNEVAAFDSIVIDEDSLHPWEFVEEAEKNIQGYSRDVDYLRPQRRSIPAYLTSEREARTEEEKCSLRKIMDFAHRKEGHSIRYYYEDGLLILSYVSTTCSPRPRSPPSPSASLHCIPSSSHKGIHARSISGSRQGSLPRDLHFGRVDPYHTIQVAPQSPGMFIRLLNILRSSA